MKLKWGTYEFNAKEVRPRPNSTVLRTPRGVRYAERITVDVTGAIHGDTQSELITNVDALLSALSTDGQDFLYEYDDGTDTSDLAITSSNTLGGTRITRMPFFTPSLEGNYTTYWQYTFTMEAEVLSVLTTASIVWEHSDTIQQGGTTGPSTVHVPQKNSPWQKQQNRKRTLHTATQTGELVGLFGYLDNLIPAPRWPKAELNERRTKVKQTPRQVMLAGGTTFLVYPITYTYEFESNTPLPETNPPLVL